MSIPGGDGDVFNDDRQRDVAGANTHGHHCIKHMAITNGK